MKNIRIITSIILSISLFNSFAQNCRKFEGLLYKGYFIDKTLNKSFVNKRMIFIKEKDTIFINQKLPFDPSKKTFYDYGLYYNCHLRKDEIYSIGLKKISLKDIPRYFNNYYRINAIFNDEYNLSKYIEIIKNTKFLIKGYYVKYLDMNNEIYEIVNLSPTTDCGIIH